MKPLLSIALISLFGLFLFVSQPAFAADLAADLVNGEAVFQTHCVGCHIHGGNIVRRGKTLKLKALQKNKMDSIAAITEIVTHGKNNMSAYGDRLSTPEIQNVAAYVLEQAQQDWKS
ncbi:MAG TPA: c-type cytochrome [Trichocoleus sp.]